MGNRGQVVSQHPVLRDLLPFYTGGQLLFGAGLAASTYGLLSWLGEPAALLITGSGVVGLALVNWTARPSLLLLDEQQVPLLLATLRSIGYRYSPERDHWVPPLPRWLRWKFNVVKLVGVGERVRVTGPANALKFLSAKAS